MLIILSRQGKFNVRTANAGRVSISTSSHFHVLILLPIETNFKFGQIYHRSRVDLLRDKISGELSSEHQTDETTRKGENEEEHAKSLYHEIICG